MISDDLSGLFGPPPAGMGAAIKVVQGYMLAFNPLDGTNQVTVNGGVIPNVPMLLTGAEVSYTLGDPVLLLVLGNTYMLLGKVATAGGPLFASVSTATGAYSANAVNTAYTASATTTINTATLQVPSWANRMAFFGMAEHSFHGATDADMYSQHVMNGNPSGGVVGWAAANHTVMSTKYQSGIQTVTPGAVLTILGQFQCQVSGTINQSNVSGVALFSKV